MKRFEELLPHIISILVVIILAYYYFILSGRPITINFINAVVAFSAVFTIGLAFVMGSCAKFANLFNRCLAYRKTFGLWGFSLAALHTLIVPFILIGETGEFSFGDVASLVFAGIAFMIFILMALTSTNKWLGQLGYDNWKNLQRTGYIAIVFVLIHIVLLEHGIFLTRLTGQIAIGFILLILLMRGIALILRIPSIENIEV